MDELRHLLFLPPVSVFFKVGCSADLAINILLCFLGYIPGIIHAWYIIAKTEGAWGEQYIKDHRQHTSTAPASSGRPMY